MIRALFICSRNRWRSPTAEAVFANWKNVETDSAGFAEDAETRLSAEQIEWADIIFVMEKRHRAKLKRQYGRHLRAKRIICLDIPDNYQFMDPQLVGVIQQRAGPHLASA